MKVGDIRFLELSDSSGPVYVPVHKIIYICAHNSVREHKGYICLERNSVYVNETPEEIRQKLKALCEEDFHTDE